MRKTIFFLLFAVIVTSCSTVLLTGRKQLLLVNDSEVLASSFQSYKQFIDSVPASKDKVNTALIKKVGAKLSKVVEDYLNANGRSADAATYAWEFNLVKDTTMNAFCMPGGKVVVYEGILPVTKNEVGLAVVLGHEIAHAVAKHSNERMSQQMLVQYGASITDMLTSKKSTVARSTISTIYGLGSQYGVILPYSRLNESEADKLGLIFLAMAGYDPNEAINFWGRMAASSTSKPIEFMSTHPSDETRIAQLKAYLPEAMKYYKK